MTPCQALAFVDLPAPQARQIIKAEQAAETTNDRGRFDPVRSRRPRRQPVQPRDPATAGRSKERDFRLGAAILNGMIVKDRPERKVPGNVSRILPLMPRGCC